MSEDEEYEVEVVPDDEFEYYSYVMTIMLKEVNPEINEGLTYELFLESMYKGIDEDGAKKLGEAIKNTVAKEGEEPGIVH